MKKPMTTGDRLNREAQRMIETLRHFVLHAPEFEDSAERLNWSTVYDLLANYSPEALWSMIEESTADHGAAAVQASYFKELAELAARQYAAIHANAVLMLRNDQGLGKFR